MEEQHGLRPHDLIPLLRECTRDLRHACIGGLGAAGNVIDEVNTRRWWGKRKSNKSHENGAASADINEGVELDVSIEQLRVAIASFKTHDRLAIVRPFIPIVQAFETEANKKPKELPLRMLIQCSVYCAILITSAEAILDLLLKVQETSRKRTKSRLWAPKGLRAVGKVLLGRNHNDSQAQTILGEGERPEIDQIEEAEEEPYREFYSIEFELDGTNCTLRHCRS